MDVPAASNLAYWHRHAVGSRCLLPTTSDASVVVEIPDAVVVGIAVHHIIIPGMANRKALLKGQREAAIELLVARQLS